MNFGEIANWPVVVVCLAVIYVAMTLVTVAKKSKPRIVAAFAIVGAVIIVAIGLFDLIKMSR